MCNVCVCVFVNYIAIILYNCYLKLKLCSEKKQPFMTDMCPHNQTSNYFISDE